MENESYIFNHFSDQYYEENPKIFSRAPPPTPRYVLLAPLANSPVINGELTGKIKSPVNPMKKKTLSYGSVLGIKNILLDEGNAAHFELCSCDQRNIFLLKEK